MLPPVLEVYVVWHPQDAGAPVAATLIDHFHGDAFSGLIGGAMEVFVRSAGWDSPNDAPRPLPVVESLPYDLQAPAFVAVVPVIGLELAAALEMESNPWRGYIEAIADARNAAPDRVAIVPVRLPGAPTEGRLADLLGGIQAINISSENLRRDVTQAIAQFVLGAGAVLKVFISHTKHSARDSDVLRDLIEQVRYEIAHSRLDEFFDEHDLQPGRDWAPELLANATTSALLAVRTDLYATRRWCQHEVLTAKRAGMPVVILDALAYGEDRGSFLMDHAPRVPRGTELAHAIRTALGHLVDECLKRALWNRQRMLTEEEGRLDVAWWAPHAPEPTTMLNWLTEGGAKVDGDEPVLVLHPDPPLGPHELAVMAELAHVAGIDSRMEILTPRGLATLGG